MICKYCLQESHPTIESIKKCMDIRMNVVKSAMILHGFDLDKGKEF